MQKPPIFSGAFLVMDFLDERSRNLKIITLLNIMRINLTVQIFLSLLNRKINLYVTLPA